MPDFAAWALADALTVEQAACLWVGANPTDSSFRRPTAQRDRIAAVQQMLTSAIQSGKLPADTSTNALAMIADHSKSVVTREALRAFAESKKQRPAFLFDTLLPESEEADADSSEKVDRHRSRGGRPPEYDWDAFVIEIIRIANSLDGLPEKQSELIKAMLQWCEDTWGRQPAESGAKKKISEIYNGLGLGKKSQKPSAR